MKNRFITSAKGITLVELLVSLALVGVVSTLIVGVLVSGTKSFEKVSKEVSLHDEANYIMTMFANEIFEATSVTSVPSVPEGEKTKLISITKYGSAEEIQLGFDNEQAVIKGKPLHSSSIKILNSSQMKVYDGTVHINLAVQGKDTKKVTLTSEVSFVNVEKEE
ncbi:PilW family protein [Bacillus tuaregi]|uniref:PilW family protein n=1 Tax=Bacillus tuaregi TaxID=1816695 RepID=UPI0008F82069|nr:prepilin-type N-terminal cleavage/methylation domain-containing protein [Bacillus tuaregi]